MWVKLKKRELRTARKFRASDLLLRVRVKLRWAILTAAVEAWPKGEIDHCCRARRYTTYRSSLWFRLAASNCAYKRREIIFGQSSNHVQLCAEYRKRKRVPMEWQSPGDCVGWQEEAAWPTIRGISKIVNWEFSEWKKPSLLKQHFFNDKYNKWILRSEQFESSCGSVVQWR